MLTPKLWTTLQTYDRQQFFSDLTAGVIVGIVALPLAIAFAIASGVTPDRGLTTAIIAGFLISALGGSRVQIGGPTGAFVVIVYAVVQAHGVDGLIIATMMAGMILVALGAAGFGGAIKFIPHPVTIGFTSGIALIIFSSQVKDLLGLEMGDVPAEFIEKWAAYAEAIDTINPMAVAIGAISLAILIFWPRVSLRIPGPFVALLSTTALVHLLGLDVETIGDRFGVISASLSAPSFPAVDLARIRDLMGPAFTIALLGGIESLLSAVVADGMIGGKHRSNVELVGQGIVNIVTPLFGGIPATGAIARTATNVRNGARTPVAGMMHALTLLLIALFFGRLVGYIPFATLGAILVVVAYHMSEWRTFVGEFRAPLSDLAVLLVTFTLTIVVDLTVAIEVGMVLAAFLFMKRMAEVTNVTALTREFREDNGTIEDQPIDPASVPPGVEIYEINGPFFFGAAETFKEQVGGISQRPRVLIIRMRHVPAIDSTGLHALGDVVRRSRKDGVRVILSGVHAQPLMALGRSPLLDELGEENLAGSLSEALEAARTSLEATPTTAGKKK